MKRFKVTLKLVSGNYNDTAQEKICLPVYVNPFTEEHYHSLSTLQFLLIDRKGLLPDPVLSGYSEAKSSEVPVKRNPSFMP